ncbi:MAG: AbrB family transcriptional regulator [Proteobacteria bacterium]|nr:AbrB family transcriptional regulator [Pseudomonadota bacterium]
MSPDFRFTLRWGRVLPALGLAACAGALAQALHVPLPWMIGPLFSVALARIAGWMIEGPPGGRQAGQWAIGTALGLYFTPLVLAHLAENLLLIGLMAGSAVGIGMVSAWLIHRWAGVSPATAFFAGLPGGASEMVVLAERQGGAPDRVAAAHALRVMMVVSVVPFILYHWGGQGHDSYVPALLTVEWGRFPLLVAASLLGVGVFRALRIANAWVLGPLACIAALTAAQVPLSALPGWLVGGGQLLLGVALGGRFSPEFFRAAPRFLAVSAASTLLALLLSGLFVLALAACGAVSLPSLLLAASPGGMAEMCVTAKVLHLGVPLITATHVLRVVLITVCAPKVCGFFLRFAALPR